MSRLNNLARRVLASSLATLGLGGDAEAAAGPPLAPPLDADPRVDPWSPKADLSKKLLLRLNEATGEVDAVSHRSHRSHSSHRSHYSSRSSSPSPRTRSTPRAATPRYTAPAPRVLGSRTLSRGSVGEDVAELVRRLERHGHVDRVYIGSTEVYTSSVESAVRAFQRSASLETDGVAGSETIRMLKLEPYQITPPSPPPAARQSPGAVPADSSERVRSSMLGARKLKFGMEGPDVADLIRRLKQGGYLPGLTSGDTFTAQVDEGVKRFQREHGLEADGIVGRETVLKLKAETSSLGAAGAGAPLAAWSGDAEIDGSDSPLEDVVPLAVALGLIALYIRNKAKGDDTGT